jgi:hypothetical protein
MIIVDLRDWNFREQLFAQGISEKQNIAAMTIGADHAIAALPKKPLHSKD